MLLLTFTHPGLREGAMPQPRRRRATAAVVGALVGILGGAAAAVLGGLLTAIAWFITDESARQGLTTSGAVLLYLTIPLLAFGACCGDWAEKHDAERRARRTRDEDGEQ